MDVLKFLTLSSILLYASVYDIRRHEVPNFVSVMVLVLSLVNSQTEDIHSMLFGAVAVFIPLLAVSLMSPDKAIGGADIKISAASGFLLGASRGLAALVIGLVMSVIIVPITRKIRKLPNTEPYPLVPFLSVGILTAYFI